MRKNGLAVAAIATFSGLAALGSACTSFSSAGADDDAAIDAAIDAASEAPSPDASGGVDSGSGEGGEDAASHPVNDPYATAVLSDNPLAYWRLDENAGPDAVDMSGNAYTGSYIGNVSFDQPGALGANASDPCIGLQGTGWVTTKARRDPTAALVGSMSLEAWVNVPSNINLDFGIISNETSDSGFAFAILSGKLTFTSKPSAGAPSTSLNALLTFPTNGWHHVVAVFESSTASTLTLYVDAASGAVGPAPQPATGATSFVMGARVFGTEDLFVGLIDEVAVYGTALSPARIMAHYAAGTGAAPPANP